MVSPHMVLRRRKIPRAPVSSRSRSVQNPTVDSSVGPSLRSRLWSSSRQNGSKNNENAPRRKKRKLDDGSELPAPSTSKQPASAREQTREIPRRSPLSPNTRGRKTRSRTITAERRESLRPRKGPTPRPNALPRGEPDSGCSSDHRSNHSRSAHVVATETMENKITGLMKETGRLQKIAAKAEKITEVLAKRLVSFEKINRQQGAQIDKLKSANKKFGDKLSMIRENLQCQICLELLALPHALVPCGHVFCQKCLQDWFRSAPGRDDGVDNVEDLPAVLKNKTCPCCRSSMRNRPIPLFVLKNALSAFASNIQTISESARDPWKDIFVPDLDFSESGGRELSETDSDTDDSDDDSDSGSDGHYVGLRIYRGSETEDTHDEMESDEISSDDSSYETDMETPSWAPARLRHEMTREMFPDISSQRFRLLRRGVLPQMVEHYNIRYDEDEGIVAWTPHGAEVYLGWNIRLPVDDFIDGRLFMSWVERNILDEPENWLHDVSEDHPVYRRLVPRWRRYELLTPRSDSEGGIEASESD